MQLWNKPPFFDFVRGKVGFNPWTPPRLSQNVKKIKKLIRAAFQQLQEDFHMGMWAVRLTAGAILIWLLANALAGPVDWGNPILLGFLAVLLLLAWNPLGLGSSRRPGQPPALPTTEERVGDLEEEMGRHQAEHAWERWLEFLKELFSRREEGPKEGQGGLLLPGLLVAVVLIGAMFFFGIIPMPFGGSPAAAPTTTPSVGQGQEVVLRSPQVRGYTTLDEARKGATFGTGWPTDLRLFVKRQVGEFTLACLKGEGACWWFPTKDLRPATPPPIPTLLRPTPRPGATPPLAEF